MDMATASQIALVFSVLMSAASLVVSWWRGQSKEVDRRVAAAESRIGALEKITHEAPSRTEVHGIQLAMAEMSGSLRVISAQMSGQSEILRRVELVVGRHEDHLLGKPK